MNLTPELAEEVVQCLRDTSALLMGLADALDLDEDTAMRVKRNNGEVLKEVTVGGCIQAAQAAIAKLPEQPS